MKAVLLNDTRSEQHAGCRLVVENLERECVRAGIHVVATSPASCADDTAFVQDAWNALDMVLINGEGTMHDDQPRALSLANAGRWASERGKPVVLLNSVWQNNRRVNLLLPYLDAIFCRESHSAAEVSRAGFNAEVAPDLVFATATESLLTESQGRRGVAVLDSVLPKVSRALARRACWRRHSYLPMSRATYSRIREKTLLRWAITWRCPGGLRPPEGDFLARLARHEAAISGRFHGVCMCFLSHTPVAAVASNTHKIEGLYCDAGLDVDLVLRLDRHSRLPPVREFYRRLDEMRSQFGAVHRYVAEAPERISEMFRRIRALATRRRAG
jgi:hypothetical protein